MATQPEVIPLGYVQGQLWRLVVLPADMAAGRKDTLPQPQRQHPETGRWELAAHDDLTSHVAWQAYRRGQRSARQHSSPLIIPGQRDDD